MTFLLPLIPEIPAAAAATAAGLAGLGAAATNPDVQKFVGNGVSKVVNGVGAKLSDLGKVSGGIVKGLSSEFSHGAGNSSYHTSRTNSMAIPLQKPVVMSNPGVSIPRGGVSGGTPAHVTTLRGGTMTTPSHTSTLRGGTMSTPEHSATLSGVTELPDTAVKTGALAGTKTLANTDALVAERTLPRLPKEEVTSKLPKLDIPNAPTVPPLTLDQESANIGRANNFKLGADN